MLARQTAEYSAPLITEHRSLQAAMMPGLGSIVPESDAAIKHGVQAVPAYQAPAINEQRDLDGRLQFKSDRAPVG